MTREEAIERIKNGEWRKSENNNKGNIESICDIIQQIDEPKWHKVSEEGLPTEEGCYRIAIRFAQEISIYEVITNFDGVEFQSRLPKYEVPKGIIIAWQKITPYEG